MLLLLLWWWSRGGGRGRGGGAPVVFGLVLNLQVVLQLVDQLLQADHLDGHLGLAARRHRDGEGRPDGAPAAGGEENLHHLEHERPIQLVAAGLHELGAQLQQGGEPPLKPPSKGRVRVRACVRVRAGACGCACVRACVCDADRLTSLVRSCIAK